MGFLPTREDILEYLNADEEHISALEKVDMLKKISLLAILSAKKTGAMYQKDVISQNCSTGKFPKNQKRTILKRYLWMIIEHWMKW